MKKIIIAGGSGFLGKILTSYFKPKTEHIVILTRGIPRTEDNVSFVHWDAKNLDHWTKEIDQADVVINLTGKSVDCRYTPKNKALILNSRITSTKILGKAIQLCKTPPKLWINSSTATIYRHSLDKEMTETSGELGKGFSVTVAKSWENEFFNHNTPHTRKVALRTSIVLGKKGGALPPIINLVKLGLGGKQGMGNQKISWIHEIDFARSLEFIMDHSHISGVINIVSPTPVTNYIFMKKLREVLKIPIGIPLSKSILTLGAKIINTETELILKSRNVIPKKLQQSGFQFHFSSIDLALPELVYS